MPVFPVLDNGALVPLTLFTMGDLMDVRSLTQFRAVYSPRARTRGDNMPQATSIDFTGIIQGTNISAMMDKRDTIIAAVTRGEQWLKFYENGEAYSRMLNVGRCLRKESSFLDQRSMRVIQMSVSLELINPFWQSLEEHSQTVALIEGANALTLNNAGTALAYPEFEITGTDITSITIAIGGRTLQWTSPDALGAGTLIIDSLRGMVTLDGGSSLALVQDGSLFPELSVGDNSVSVTIVGASGGELVTRHRDAWEL